MRSPSPGRNKAQAPPGKGQDLGLSDVRRRRADYGCPGFLASSCVAAGLGLRLRRRLRLRLRLRLGLRPRAAAGAAA